MLDIFILIVLVWSLYSGWRAGLVREISSTVGYLVGLLIAATCYSSFGQYLAVSGSESNIITSLIAFALLWILVPIALGFVANMLTRTLRGLHLGWLNSLLGAAVSLLKFAILLSCLLSAMSALGILNEQRTASSQLYAPFKSILSEAVDQVVSKSAAGAKSDSADQERSDTTWIDVQH